MKRIFVSTLIISLLSGCIIYNNTDTKTYVISKNTDTKTYVTSKATNETPSAANSKKQGKMLILEEKSKVIDNIESAQWNENGNELSEEVYYDSLEKSYIKIVQKEEFDGELHSQNEITANVYVDNKNNIIIAKDNRLACTYNNSNTIPESYIDIINKISDYNMRYSDGAINGKYDRLDFVNDEYAVCNPESSSIFSSIYQNVYIDINNAPIKIIAYVDNSKAVKLHIIGIRISYAQNIITDKNIESINNTLAALGVENNNELTEEFKKYFEGGSASNKIGEYNIDYYDNSFLSMYNSKNNKLLQKDMIVSLT